MPSYFMYIIHNSNNNNMYVYSIKSHEARYKSRCLAV